MSTKWTDGEVQTLKALWIDGVSAGLIAKDLGRSRNAVIGKANRLVEQALLSARGNAGTAARRHGGAIAGREGWR